MDDVDAVHRPNTTAAAAGAGGRLLGCGAVAQLPSTSPAAAGRMVRVSTALTPTMHAWVQTEARELGISISTFIRLRIGAARKEAEGVSQHEPRSA